MSKKTWILITCLVLSLAMGLGGSLAYLTDRDADVNVFTMGNVDIELTEDFEQGAELIPGVDIKKEVRVENVGNNDAWVWVDIAIPKILDDTNDASSNVVHFNYSKDAEYAEEWNWKNDEGKWAVRVETIGDIEYNVYTVKRIEPLAAKATTGYPVMHKVYMDPHVDITPDGQLYHVEKGVATDLNWNINEDGAPYMYVSAYAIQTNGFDTVDDAYNAYNAQWTTEGGENNGLIWADPAEVAIPAKVSSVDEINEAIANGNLDISLSGDVKDVRQNFYLDYVNGNGHAVRVEEYDYNSNCTFTMQAGTIKNIEIFGAPRAIGTGSTGMELQGDLIIDSVYVDDGTYAINVGNGASHSVKVNNSELFGWISVDGADLEFTNSTLGERTSDYHHIAIYDSVLFDNCNLLNLKMFGRPTTTEGAVIEFRDCRYFLNGFPEKEGEWEEGVDFYDITPENVKEYLIDWTDTDSEYLKKCTLIVDGVTVAW